MVLSVCISAQTFDDGVCKSAEYRIKEFGEDKMKSMKVIMTKMAQEMEGKLWQCEEESLQALYKSMRDSRKGSATVADTVAKKGVKHADK